VLKAPLAINQANRGKANLPTALKIGISGKKKRPI
jgi:hypothetical protein